MEISDITDALKSVREKWNWRKTVACVGLAATPIGLGLGARLLKDEYVPPLGLRPTSGLCGPSDGFTSVTPNSASMSPQEFASYNQAEGNHTANGKNEGGHFHADETARLVGQEFMRGEYPLDAMASQETSDSSDATAEGSKKTQDYMLEDLGNIFRESLGGEWTNAKLSWQSLENGRAVRYDSNKYDQAQLTVTMPDGATKTLSVDVDHLDWKGHPDSAAPSPLHVYSMKLPDGRQYVGVFGASNTNTTSSYGNSLLLGPRYELQREPDGTLKPGTVQVHLLGLDPDGEQRTALSVEVLLPSGKKEWLFALHLTNGVAQDGARQVQYANFYKQVEALDKNEPKIVGGDWNSKPGSSRLFPSFPFGNTHVGAPPKESGLVMVNQTNDIDHIMVTKNADVVAKTCSVDGGGSDHDMLRSFPAGAGKRIR